jgi:hypothetical protein
MPVAGGGFGDANVTLSVAAGIAPLIAAGRQPHHPTLRERFAEAPPAPDNPTPLQAMTHVCGRRKAKRLYAYASRRPSRCSGSSNR